MTKDERAAWLYDVFEIYINALLDYRMAEAEFFNLWYAEIFNEMKLHHTRHL